MTTTYEIEQLQTKEDLLKPEVVLYLLETGPQISKLFGNKFNYKNTDYLLLAEKCIFLVCKRNGRVNGHMVCYMSGTPLDPEVKILSQLSFYVNPASSAGDRTAYHLFQKFIDIGKDRANHIITMLTSQTNIKPSTLEKYGFKELETLYRMEI